MMNSIRITEEIEKMKAMLKKEDRSQNTIEKYSRDVRAFLEKTGEIDEMSLILYKKRMIEENYKPSSINSMICSVNKYLKCIGKDEYCLKGVRIQKSPYISEERILNRNEYLKLVKAAESNERIKILLQTICSCGIRVSELKYFTVEAVGKGEVEILLKGKSRKILIPEKLQIQLLAYSAGKGIKRGEIFINKNGGSLNRSTVWAMLKSLGEKAGINKNKIFPHNLRRLFARTFHELEPDLSKLADVLGHSSVDTTRLYIASSGAEHKALIEKMNLIT